MKAGTVLVLTTVFLLFFSGPVEAQETDLSVVISDSEDPVDPGAVVAFVVTVANAGPDHPPNPVILDISMPMDVPVPWQEYLDADEDERAAIVDLFQATANILVDDNIWDDDISGIYIGDSFNNSCESMMVQPQDLLLPAGTSGQIHYEAVLPPSGGVSGLAYAPATGGQIVVNYGVGGCNSDLFDDCSGIPCMGPRLTMHPTVGAPVSPVNDGTDPVGDGCEPPVDFPAGHIALIDRGACNFSRKGDHATQAGASGVIIANTVALGSVTPTPDSTMTMGCTDAVCHSLIITIPAAFMSFNAGEELKAWMDLGQVMMYMGIRQEVPEFKQTKGYIWEPFPNENDTNPDNNRFTETTHLNGGGGGGGGGGECSYVLSPTSREVSVGGGSNFTLYVSTQEGCQWALDSVPPWVTITSASSGTGFTQLTYDVTSNQWGQRIGAITLEASSHTITQEGVTDGGNQLCGLIPGPEDGSAEDGLGWGIGDRFVQKFTPDAYPFTIGSACIAFTRAGGDTECDFDLVVFDDDGPFGSPGTLLASIPTRAIDIPYWLDYAFTGVDLNGLIPEITDGAVYVGAAWDENLDRPFYIPTDLSPRTPVRRAFFGSGDHLSGWTSVQTVEPNFRSLFIHVADNTSVGGDWETIVGPGAHTPSGFGVSYMRTVTQQFSLEGKHCVAASNTASSYSARLFCSSDLVSWMEMTDPITSGSGYYNRAITSSETLEGSRIVGTYNYSYGGEIWKRTDDLSWTRIAAGGISTSANRSFSVLENFDGRLYAGTENSTGTEVFRTSDGTNWETLQQDGLDSPINTVASSMAVFNDELYLGVANTDGGCSIWKTLDGIAWFKEIEDCFGTLGGSPLLVTHGDSLYVGLTGSGEVRRTTDGFFWPTVFSQSGISRLDSLTEYNGSLFLAGGFGTDPGSTIWTSADSAEWTQISIPGFGNELNTSVPSLSGSPFGLLAGVRNVSQGAEVWLLSTPIFNDGFESGDTSSWQ